MVAEPDAQKVRNIVYDQLMTTTVVSTIYNIQIIFREFTRCAIVFYKALPFLSGPEELARAASQWEHPQAEVDSQTNIHLLEKKSTCIL